MSDFSPIDPHPPVAPPAAPIENRDTETRPFAVDKAPKASSTEGGAFSSFRKFLGPENFKKFQNQLCQSLSKMMSREAKRMKKAAQNLKNAEKGLPPE